MQNLHGLVALLPDDTQQLVNAFRRRFKPGRMGTLLSDISAMDTSEFDREDLPPQGTDQETRSLLGEWMHKQRSYSKLSTPTQASYLRKCEHHGVELKPKQIGFGDSLVILGDHASWKAAQIEALLGVRLYPSGAETYHTVAKIRYFAELSQEDALRDPYRRFQNTGRVFYEAEWANKEVVSVDRILCHFAMTPNVCSGAILKAHIHALPLV